MTHYLDIDCIVSTTKSQIFCHCIFDSLYSLLLPTLSLVSTILYCFLLLSNTPLWKYDLVCLPFTYWWNLRCFLFRAVSIESSYEYSWTNLFYGHMFLFPRSRMARLYGTCTFNFLNNCQTVFQNDCVILHRHLLCVIIQIPPHQYLVWTVIISHTVQRDIAI